MPASTNTGGEGGGLLLYSVEGKHVRIDIFKLASPPTTPTNSYTSVLGSYAQRYAQRRMPSLESPAGASWTTPKLKLELRCHLERQSRIRLES